MSSTVEQFGAPAPAGADFVVDLEGFEGPIDLLLSLAREQKVDLAKISILALAEQYLAYVERARHLKLELAADYLVMAAWLAYLKSRLLLPEGPGDDEPSGAELAEALALRLRRLEAIRRAEQRLTIVAAPVFRVEDALRRLSALLGGPDWRNLLTYLPPGLGDERLRRSALAAHLGACL